VPRREVCVPQWFSLLRERLSNFSSFRSNRSPAGASSRQPAQSSGMSRQNGDLPQYGLRLVENAELSQHRPSVVTDPFRGEVVMVVEHRCRYAVGAGRTHREAIRNPKPCGMVFAARHQRAHIPVPFRRKGTCSQLTNIRASQGLLWC
jgi:hypothetical protein